MDHTQYHRQSDDTGNVFSFGEGSEGQSGHYYLESDNVILPMRIAGLQSYGIRKIACGKANSFAISEMNDLYGWGDGLSGQLGFGEKGISNEPYLIGRGFKDISSGRVHTLALSDEGFVYSFGDSDEGLTGHGDEEDLIVPRRVSPSVFSSSKVVKVECGYFHSACITEAGHLYTWGRGASFCLGNGSTDTVRLPQRIYIQDEEGQETAVLGVSCGRAHTLVLTDKHHVYGFGDNSCGQVGVDRAAKGREQNQGSKVTRVVEKPCRIYFSPIDKDETKEVVISSVNAGSLHSCALTAKHKLYVWGCGTSGQLGLCNFYNKRSPTLIGDSLGGIQSVSCGDRHTVCINQEGKVYGWGRWILRENILAGSGITYHTPYQIYPPKGQLKSKKAVKFCNVACGGHHTLLLSRYKNTKANTIRAPRDSLLGSIGSRLTGKVQHRDCVQFVCENKNDKGESDIRLLLLEKGIKIHELLTTIARCYRRKMSIKMFKDRDSEDSRLFINTDHELRRLMMDEVNHQIPIIVSPASEENLKAAGLLDIPMSSVANQLRGHSSAITCMTQRGDIVYTGSNDYVIRGWNKWQGMCEKVFEGHSDKITDIAMQADPENPGNAYLCTSAYDNSVRVWNIQTEECIKVFKLHTDSVTRIVCADDHLLCSVGVDCRMVVWDMKQMSEVAVIEKHKYPVSAVVYDKQTHSIFTGDVDGTIYRWELKDVRKLKSAVPPVLIQSGQTRDGVRHKGAISCFSVCGSLLFSGSNDNSIICWNLETNKSVRQYSGDQGHHRMVTAIANVTGKSFFFSSSLDESVIMWDMESGIALRTIANHLSEVQFDTHKANGFMYVEDGLLVFSGLKTYTAENAKKKGMRPIEYVTYVYEIERLENRETATGKCCSSILFGHFGPITCSIKDKDFIYTASQDTHARSYSMAPTIPPGMIHKKTSLKSENIHASFGEKLTYQIKPQIMAPITFFLLLVDFAQMIAFPFTIEDRRNLDQGIDKANSVMRMFQLSFSDGWRLFFWLICSFIIPSVVIMFHFSPEVNYQNIRFKHVMGTPNPWKFVWLFLFVFILLVTGSMSVPLTRQLLEALNCRFMVPSIVSDCYGSSHVLYVIISLLALLVYSLLVFRLVAVENDISCINKQELDSRLKGERQSIPGRSYLVEMKERWLSWKGDRPIHNNIHYMSKRHFSIDRLYVIIKTALVMVSVYFSDDRLIVGYILFILMSFMVVAIVRDPPYYSRKISALRLSLVMGMLWAFLHSIIYSYIDVSPTEELVVLGGVMCVTIPVSYFLSYQLFIFRKKSGKVAPLSLPTTHEDVICRVKEATEIMPVTEVIATVSLEGNSPVDNGEGAKEADAIRKPAALSP